jgi:protein TonB
LRAKDHRIYVFGRTVARISFSCNFSFPKSPSPYPSLEGEGETPLMMKPNFYSPYLYAANVRRNSLNALLLSFAIHSAVIFAIFLAGLTFCPVSADLSPLVVTITPLADGSPVDAREVPAGKKEKSISNELTRPNPSIEPKADLRSIEPISPSTEPIPQKTDISQSSAMEIHDLTAPVRRDQSGGTTGNGANAIKSASNSGGRIASGAIPQYGNNPLPAYPSMARKMGHEGVVLLAAEILSDGRVGQLAVKKSSGHPTLDQSALDAVKKWKFIPAKWMGKAVSAWVDVPVKFQLSQS